MYINIEVLTVVCQVLFIPIIGVLLISAFSKIESIQKFIPTTIAVMSFFSVLFLASWHKDVIKGTNDVSYKIIEANYSDAIMLTEKLKINFVVEPIGITFSLVSSFLLIINCIYSKSYFNSRKNYQQTSFFIFLFLSIFATYGLAFSANLITSFVFYELLTVFTLPLVNYKSDESKRPKVKIYFYQLMLASIGLMLPALIIIESVKPGMFFSTYGSIYTNFQHINKQGSLAISIAMILLVHGCAKAAIFPLNSWLSAAMVAPTPVSAFLHAVAVVKSGIVFLIKANTYFFGHNTELATQLPKVMNYPNYLILLASITMIIASFRALKAKELKSILAFSTISQLSYIVGAAAMSNKASLQSAMLQLAAHSFGKITLFFAVGAIYTKTQKTNLKQIKGIGYQMPFTMLFFSVCALSIIGIPPTFGSISKSKILQQTALSGNLIFMASLLISSSLSAIYLIKVPYFAFKRSKIKASQQPIKINEAPISMIFCMATTTAITILFYFNQNLLNNILK